MGWDKVPDENLPNKARRTAVRDTAEFIEVVHTMTHNRIEKGTALVLRQMPKVNGMSTHRIVHNFASGLKVEIGRLNLPFKVIVYDNRELIVRRLT